MDATMSLVIMHVTSSHRKGVLLISLHNLQSAQTLVGTTGA